MHDNTDPFSDLTDVTFLGDEESSGLAHFSYWWDSECAHHMQVRWDHALRIPVAASRPRARLHSRTWMRKVCAAQQHFGLDQRNRRRT